MGAAAGVDVLHWSRSRRKYRRHVGSVFNDLVPVTPGGHRGDTEGTPRGQRGDTEGTAEEVPEVNVSRGTLLAWSPDPQHH